MDYFRSPIAARAGCLALRLGSGELSLAGIPGRQRLCRSQAGNQIAHCSRYSRCENIQIKLGHPGTMHR